jgi:exonuclease III
MAFRKKAARVIEFNPDLAIIPECESLAKLSFSDGSIEPKDKIWIGENLSKGIGIFSYSDLKIKVHESYDPKFKYVVPIQVSGKENFDLIAVWAMDNKEYLPQRYIGQVWLALQKYEHLLSKSVLIVGDFNWNKIWDGSRNIAGNLMAMVEFLKAKGISSLYHQFFREGFGQETRPTWYMYRHVGRPYHIDYCFGSSDFADRLQLVEVGKHEAWHQWSDHTPILCSFDVKSPKFANAC